MRIYISGAITGTDDYMERFKEVEDRLTKEGMTVINPALINSNLPEGTTYEEYMKIAFCLLDMCDAIYMMAGWEKSCGANREYGYALAKDMVIMQESGDRNKKMTNGDKLRGMNDGELAEWLSENVKVCGCFANEECNACDGDSCAPPMLEWLRKGAEG